MPISVLMASPGPASLGAAIGEYNPETGEIAVSVNGVNNWYVERVGQDSMIGETPMGLPTTGEMITDNNYRIGVSSFSQFTFTNLTLGNVAQTYLPNDGELKIFWNTGLGSQLQMQSLEIGDYNYPTNDYPPDTFIEESVTTASPSPPSSGTTSGENNFGTAAGEYNPTTGEITVSVNGVNNWYIERVGQGSMTGDAPLGLPTTGEMITDNDDRIGVSSFSPFTSTNLNLGNVAQTFLPNDGELKIFWNTGLGSQLQVQSLEIGDYNYPPLAFFEEPSGVDIVNDALNITLDASLTTDDGKTGPLSYRWDLDNDNIFEFDSGNVSTLSIADVTSTFGGQGTYPVAVEVFDGEYWDVSSTSVSLFVPQPDPPEVEEIMQPSEPIAEVVEETPIEGVIDITFFPIIGEGDGGTTVVIEDFIRLQPTDINSLIFSLDSLIGFPVTATLLQPVAQLDLTQMSTTGITLGSVESDLYGVTGLSSLLTRLDFGSPIEPAEVIVASSLISDEGQGFVQSVTLTAPEPTSLLQLVLGLVAMIAPWRARRSLSAF